MSLSTVVRVEFDPDVAHSRGELKRSVAGSKRKPDASAAEPDPEATSFAIISEGGTSTAGLSILAHALAAYSDS